MRFRSFASACCVVFVLHSPAIAQPCAEGLCPRTQSSAAQATAPHPAVVRIRNVTSQSSASVGSGALVGRDAAGSGVVLTAWHLFRDGVGQVYVDFPAGARRMGTVTRLARSDDLATVLVADPPPVELRLSDNDMPSGSPISFAGYGPNGIYALQFGIVIERASFDAGATWAARSWTGQARSGDSGGPAFDALGQVCGVVSAARRGQTVGTCGPRLRQFLDGTCVPATPPRPSTNRPPASPATKPANTAPANLAVNSELKSLATEVAALREQLADVRGCQCATAQPGAKCPCDLKGLEERLVARLKRTERPPVRHLVVVADRKATSWPRLADEIRAAQAKFHRIVVSDLPPFSIGPIPQLIEYEAGKAKHVYRGERDISTQLARVRRGEYPTSAGK